jgi:hypothetical protein
MLEPIDNIFIPYCYLHKVDGSKYILSMIMNAGLFENVNMLNEEANLIRWINFRPGGLPIETLKDETFDVNNVTKATIEASIYSDQFATQQNNQNKATLLSIDVITLGEFPPLVHLPHVYLIKDFEQEFPNIFRLFVAIKNNPFYVYSINIGTMAGNRLIVIKENESTVDQDFWTGDTGYFKEIGNDIIEIEVQDVNGTVQGKGKIRYSNADNKPFDIPLIDFKFLHEECPLD